MKRIVILLLALTLTTGCAADPAAAHGGKSDSTMWKKPPALRKGKQNDTVLNHQFQRAFCPLLLHL